MKKVIEARNKYINFVHNFGSTFHLRWCQVYMYMNQNKMRHEINCIMFSRIYLSRIQRVSKLIPLTFCFGLSPKKVNYNWISKQWILTYVSKYTTIQKQIILLFKLTFFCSNLSNNKYYVSFVTYHSNKLKKLNEKLM